MTSTPVAGGTRTVAAAWRPTVALRVQVIRWATVAALLVAWEVICRTTLAGTGYLAPPSAVVTDGLPAVFRAEPLGELWATTSRFLVSFLIVVVVGVPLGAALGRLHRHVFLGARDVVSVLYALPLVPFYPLFVLWLGLGDRSEVAFGVIHGVIPVVLITMGASAAVEPNLLAAGRAMGAGPARRLLSVVMPATLPETIGALKIGAALSLLGVLLGELMISVDGVGSFLAQQISNRHAAPLDAMVLVVCLGAVVVNAVLSLVERRASSWRAEA